MTSMEFSLSRTTDETYDTTFTVKVRVDLLLEGGLVHVTGADSDTDGDSLLVLALPYLSFRCVLRGHPPPGDKRAPRFTIRRPASMVLDLVSC